MTEPLMSCGVGLLAGCLLTRLFIPMVHQRAVRLTKRKMVDAIPMSAMAMRAEKDHMRAQFAMALRQLEFSLEELRGKCADQFAALGRKTAEVTHLRAELDKRMSVILALQARDHLHGSLTRRVFRLVLFVLTRKDRQRARLLEEARRPIMRAAYTAPPRQYRSSHLRESRVAERIRPAIE